MRRRQIVSRLVELAEDNVELDFAGAFRICLQDPDEEVRGMAVEGLWESEDTSLITPFINMLERDASERVQVAVAIALGRFIMMAELGKIRDGYMTRIARVLLDIIGDKSRPIEVRRRALESVAPLILPDVGEAIREAYASEDPKLRISAIYAMGKNCHLQWLSSLLNELGSEDEEVRYEAAVACGELGEEEAALYLKGLVNDPDTEVRLAAIQALGRIGGSEAKQVLTRCLRDPSKAIREMATEALNELELGKDPLSIKIRNTHG